MLITANSSLFVVCYCFTSHSRIFHSYGDVTICRWRASNFGLYSALMAIEQWGFFNVPTSTATRDLEFYCLIRRTGNRPVQPARTEPTTSRSKVERATDWATGTAPPNMNLLPTGLVQFYRIDKPELFIEWNQYVLFISCRANNICKIGIQVQIYP